MYIENVIDHDYQIKNTYINIIKHEDLALTIFDNSLLI